MKPFKYKIHVGDNPNKPDAEWRAIDYAVGLHYHRDFNYILSLAKAAANATGYTILITALNSDTEAEDGVALVKYWNVKPFAKGRYTK